MLLSHYIGSVGITVLVVALFAVITVAGVPDPSDS
jgi:hypothetical protein